MVFQHYQRTTFCIFILGLLLFIIPFVAFAAPPDAGSPPPTANPALATAPGTPASLPAGQAPPNAGSSTPASNAPVATAPNNPASNPAGQPTTTAPKNVPEPTPDALAAVGLSPLVVQLEYVKADQVKPMLATLFPDNQIKVEFVNKTLVVTGSDDNCAAVKAILTKLDVPPRQVIFEAEAVEISRDNLRNLGINWGTVNGLTETALTDNSAFRITLGIPNHPEYGINLKGTLNRLIENKKGHLLASPRIAALDGQTARILIGDKLAVESTQISSGTTVTTVTYVEVGIKLEITPTVNTDGTITAIIKPEVSNKTDTTTSGNPNIRTRQAETTLRVKNGETIVLGGLIQRQKTSDTIKFPLLGDLPLVGMFFRSTNREVHESELIILITPKLIDP